MQNVEIYLLKHNGSGLTFSRDERAWLREFINNWEGADSSLSFEEESYVMQYALGHEENILCKIFKYSKGKGGLIAVYENSDLLLIAYTVDNLAYTEAIAHYAKLSTYTRYGHDIFMD